MNSKMILWDDFNNPGLLPKTQILGYPSVQHKDHTFSAPKIPQLNTKNASFKHLLSSTPIQTITPFRSPHPSVQHTPQLNTKTLHLNTLKVFWCWTEGGVWNWEVCWPEGFSVLNWEGGVELGGVLNWGMRNWGMCWTEVFLMNWRILGAEKKWPFCVELRGTPNFTIKNIFLPDKLSPPLTNVNLTTTLFSHFGTSKYSWTQLSFFTQPCPQQFTFCSPSIVPAFFEDLWLPLIWYFRFSKKSDV